MKSFLSLLLGGCLFATVALGADSAPIPTLALGAAAPDFKLPGVDGRDWSLADFAGSRALVVIFTCNHCPTAQAYEERIKKLVEDYRAKGAAIVAISPNDPKSIRLDELGYTDLSDTFEEMKIRARDAGFNFPYLYDGDSETVSKAFGPVTTPHAFLFDAARKLRYIGRIDDSERLSAVTTQDLRSALDAVLAGQEPAVAQTKPFGCSIKWAGKEAQVKTFMDKLAQEPVTSELVDIAGLAALRKGDGKKFRLVNFWATWCGPCVTEFPDLIEINRMYRHRNFELVTVSVNFPDEEEDVMAFLKKSQSSGRNLRIGSNNRSKHVESFESTWRGSMPFTVLLSPGGEILWKAEDDAVDPLACKRAIVKALGREMVK